MDRPYTKLYLSVSVAPGALLIDALIGTLIVGMFATILAMSTLNLSRALKEMHDDIDILNHAISCIEQLQIMEMKEEHNKSDRSIECSWHSIKSVYSYEGVSPEFLIVSSKNNGTQSRSIELITAR